MMEEMSVGRWAVDWLNSRMRNGLSRNTVGGYRNIILNHIVPRFENIPLSELTPECFRTFYAELRNGGLSDTSVWCVHLLFRRILDEACREGMLECNPATVLYVYPNEKSEACRLRSGQIKSYLEAAKSTDAYAIFYVALAGNMSLGELRTLKWSAYDAKRCIVKLPKRWITLTPTAAELLAAERKKYPENPWVFINEGSGQPFTESMLYYRHQKLLVAAKLPRLGFGELRACAKEMRL